MNDIVGDYGKLSSPGGKSKAFRNDKITITWYSNKKTLLFQGQTGNILREQIVNLLKTNVAAPADDNYTDSEDFPTSPLNFPVQHGEVPECTEYRSL